MRSQDLAQVFLTLGVGFILGVFTTLTVYSSMTSRREEETRQQIETLRAQLEEQQAERDRAIAESVEREIRAREAMEQGIGDDPIRPTPVIRPGTELPPPEPIGGQTGRDTPRTNDLREGKEGSEKSKDALRPTPAGPGLRTAPTPPPGAPRPKLEERITKP